MSSISYPFAPRLWHPIGMTVAGKLELVRALVGWMTASETAEAERMLREPWRQFAGSYSPMFVARLILTQRQSRRAA